MARGNDGRKVFLEDSDYQAFLDGLALARKRYPFYLYADVLMPNHFHLLLEVQQASTARVLQSLLTGYARRFNRTRRHRGHLFQGRYKAIVCTEIATCLSWCATFLSIQCERKWRSGPGNGGGAVTGSTWARRNEG